VITCLISYFSSHGEINGISATSDMNIPHAAVSYRTVAEHVRTGGIVGKIIRIVMTWIVLIVANFLYIW
jgi:hypothetical protein